MKDTVDNLLESHKGKMELEELPIGHKDRFLEKQKKFIKPKTNYSKYYGIAASIVLIFTIIAIWNFLPDGGEQQDFVDDMKPKSLVKSEEVTMDKVDVTKEQLLSEAGKNNLMVQRSLLELKRLELDYEQLENDLAISGSEKVIDAMHKNLELRMKILQKSKKELSKFQTETK